MAFMEKLFFFFEIQKTIVGYSRFKNYVSDLPFCLCLMYPYAAAVHSVVGRSFCSLPPSVAAAVGVVGQGV